MIAGARKRKGHSLANTDASFWNQNRMNTVLALVDDELGRERIRVLLDRQNLTPLLASDAELGLEHLFIVLKHGLR
jgi:hypothetical protein